MYDRPVLGSDVLARARTAGIEEGVCRRIGERLAAGTRVEDLECLGRAIPPAQIGMTPGAWAAVFTPLFGEFE